MRVLLHTGKGGVGKTTLALASALAAARHGHRVCVLSTDPAHSLADALASPVGPNARRVTPGVWAREIRAQVELDRGWQSVQAWLRELLREEADALVAEELLAFPGIEELVALRAVREVEQTGDFDLCIVDCAPTGSTLRMLRFPDALRIFMEHFFDLERRGARLLRPLMRGFEAGRLIPREDFFDAFERLYEDKHLIPEQNYFEVAYEELCGNELAILKQIYDKFQLPDWDAYEAAISEYISGLEGYRRNKLNIDQELMDLVWDRWRVAFDAYGYPREYPPAP